MNKGWYIVNIKKFKLTKENLDVVNLMQHMVFINISTFQDTKYMDYNDELVRHAFDVLCDNYLKLHESFSIREWRSYYDDIPDPMINKYIIYPNKELVYHLIIEINKSYHDCSKVGMQFPDRVIQPVSINIFNVQFDGS